MHFPIHKRLFFLALMFLAVHTSVQAMPANPNILELSQPDGQQIKLRFKGGPQLSWYEDLDGYPVQFVNGWYLYQSSLDSDGASNLPVGQVDPSSSGVPQFTFSQRMAAAQQASRPNESALAAINQSSGPQKISTTGTLKNLVLLMRFQNHAEGVRDLPTREDYDVLFNAIGGDPVLAPTGSIKDIYLENSYGQLTIDSTVIGWLDMPNTEAYYAGGISGLGTIFWEAVNDALDAADPSVDFSEFDEDNDGYIDAITLVHSGYPAEFGGTDEDGAVGDDRIWSHKWSVRPDWESDEGVRVSNYNINPGLWGLGGGQIGRVGVIAHELGHFLGLPDLYDIDGDGEGIGSWGLMANSWGFTGDQYNPPHMSSWSKNELNWIQSSIIEARGTYSIEQTAFSGETYKITKGFPEDEYLLIENRQPIGTESTMPQGGLAIFHIDERKFNNTQNSYPGGENWPQRHYKVAVVQADGDFDLEKGFGRGDGGDVYRAEGNSMLTPDTNPSTDAYQTGSLVPTGISITNISASGSTMTFDLGTAHEVCGGGNGLPTLILKQNLWELMSLPCVPPEGSTVADIIGDDMQTGEYGVNGDWVLFAYDSFSRAFSLLSLSDPMEVGTGYWLIQNIATTLVVDMPEASTAVVATVDGGDACVSVEGCFDRQLVGFPSVVNGVDAPVPAYWNLLGHPFEAPTSFDDLRVTSVGGVCSDADGCTMNEARAEFQVFDTLWGYNSDTSSYDEVSNGSTLEQWKGYWVAKMLDADSSIPPTVHIPKGITPGL